MSDHRLVKLTRSQKGYYQIAVNPEVANLIPESQRFHPAVLTEEGLLFRPYKEPASQLPSWINKPAD